MSPVFDAFRARCTTATVVAAFAGSLIAISAPAALLETLQRKAAVRPSELAEVLGITRPAVTKRLDALVHAGLVTRAADTKDARAVAVTVTAKGLATLAQQEATRQWALNLIVEEWSEAERDSLAAALLRFNDHVAHVDANLRSGIGS